MSKVDKDEVFARSGIGFIRGAILEPWQITANEIVFPFFAVPDTFCKLYPSCNDSKKNGSWVDLIFAIYID